MTHNRESPEFLGRFTNQSWHIGAASARGSPLPSLQPMSPSRRLLEAALTSAVLVSGTFGAIALTTKLFGDRCWPQRYGGFLVGIAVFVQGYVYANKEFFSKPSKFGLTREQRVLHQVYVV